MDQNALLIGVVSFFIGIVVGITGMGGGALMTPALIFLGVNPAAAVSNDLVAAAVSRSAGAAIHYRQGSPHTGIVKWLVIGSVPTGFAGVFVVQAIGATEDQFVFLKAAIGAALLITAATYTVRMFINLRRVVRGDPPGATDPQVRPAATLLVGMVGGLLVGITSVGAGSLMIMALLMLYPGLSPQRLVGTDLLQAVPLVVAAAASHWIVNGVDWEVLLPLMVGSTAGTFLGARVAPRVSPAVVRRGIVVLLLMTGLALLEVNPLLCGLVGLAAVTLGSLAWGGVRRGHGLPAFGSADASADLPPTAGASRDTSDRRPPDWS